MNVAIISTSPRKGSNSLKVAKYIKSLLEKKEGLHTTISDFENADIPLIGRGSIELENLTPFQDNLIQQWKEADLVIFTVPEYNWFTGGELFNAFHQLGNRNLKYLFDQKTFAFAGVSNGRGGRLPGIEMTTLLNKLISVLGGYSIVSPLIFESQATQNRLDEDGISKGDAIYEKAAEEFVTYGLAMASRWKRGA